MSRRPLLLAALLAVPGCYGLRNVADYSSRVKHEPLPLTAQVTVLIAPELRGELKAREAQALEQVRRSFQSALRKDLSENGPISPVGKDAEAQLVVTLNSYQARDFKLWIMTWFLSPLWLLGVPIQRFDAKLGMDVRLVSWRGEMLLQTLEVAECTHHVGLYYGLRDLTFACPAQQLAERLREQLSTNRAEVLARRTPMPTEVAPPPGPAPRRPRPITVVFAIQDMSGKLEENLLLQLTEYLSTQVAQQLDLKVVPREQLRERLVAQKKESYKACYDRSCQIELGRALAASKTVSSTLLQVGSRCVLNTTLIDLRTEATERAASAETSCTPEALLDAVKKAVGQLRAR
jgi:hypothetical protein